MISYKFSKRANTANWIAEHSGYIASVLLFCLFMVFGYLKIGIFLSFILALVGSTVVGFALYAVLEKLAEKWLKEDAIKYYREHPEELSALLKEAELQKNSTLKKFY